MRTAPSPVQEAVPSTPSTASRARRVVVSKFSFHVSGANVLFADGSVKLIDEDVDFKLFAALITRDQGEN